MSRTRVLFTRTFWLDAGERAIKETAGAVLIAHGLDTANAMTADWANVGWAALFGFAYSLLSSIASTPVPGISPASALPAGV